MGPIQVSGAVFSVMRVTSVQQVNESFFCGKFIVPLEIMMKPLNNIQMIMLCSSLLCEYIIDVLQSKCEFLSSCNRLLLRAFGIRAYSCYFP